MNVGCDAVDQSITPSPSYWTGHIRNDLPLTFQFSVSIIANSHIQVQIISKAKSTSLLIALPLNVYIKI